MGQNEYRKVNVTITMLIDGNNIMENTIMVDAAIEASWREIVPYPLLIALSLFFGIALMVKLFL